MSATFLSLSLLVVCGAGIRNDEYFTIRFEDDGSALIWYDSGFFMVEATSNSIET